jgi:hypothetical protein
MGTSEILQSLPLLTTTDQLKIAETALHLVQQAPKNLTRDQRRQQMAMAAMAAVEDYSSTSDLTAFTALDGEDFHSEPSGNTH